MLSLFLDAESHPTLRAHAGVDAIDRSTIGQGGQHFPATGSQHVE
jgi:hypothetical protein